MRESVESEGLKSWFKMTVEIFHRAQFEEYATILTIFVPLSLTVLLLFMALVIFTPIVHDFYKNRSFRSRHGSLIESVMIPITAAVIVFIPIYLLSLHELEAPLPMTNIDPSIANLLFYYLVVLLIGIVLRVFSKKDYSPSESR